MTEQSIDALDLLKKLVAIDSTSSRPNAPVIDVLEPIARSLGFTTRRVAYRDAAGVEKVNLVARRGPDRPGGLALVGHTDCVPFDPEWKEALVPTILNGTLVARGAADTKSFIACALAAAAEAPPIPVEPLWLVFTADEEVGCVGARALQDEGKVRPKYAIIGEPTRLIPVRAHKGYCLAELEVTGAEGHSAYPDVGASAIFAAGRLLGELERVEKALAAESSDPLFGPPHTTFNVGIIQGGKAKNIIPGSCLITFEWRPIPGQDPRRALELVEEAARKIAGGRIGVQVRPLRLDGGVATRPDAPVVRFLEDETGRKAATIPFGTELPQLTALGAEGVVFGPGDIKVAHRTAEFVPLAELADAKVVLARAIRKFCGA